MAVEPMTDGERYWLGHCEGFRVDSPGGRVGLVEAVLHGHGGSDPDALLVRAGVLGRHRVVVPAASVAGVAPRRYKLTLATSPEVSSADFVSDILRRLDRVDEAR